MYVPRSLLSQENTYLLKYKSLQNCVTESMQSQFPLEKCRQLVDPIFTTQLALRRARCEVGKCVSVGGVWGWILGGWGGGGALRLEWVPTANWPSGEEVVNTKI